MSATGGSGKRPGRPSGKAPRASDAGRSSGAKASGGAGGRGRTGGSGKPRRTGGKLKRLAAIGGIGLLVMSLLGAVAFVVLYQVIDIPDPNEEFEKEASFVYYAGGDNELGQFAVQNRDSIPLAEMPQTIKDAVIAAENRSFYDDAGLDFKGILRAAFSNAQGNATQGASTITQQYVKVLYLTQERALSRKVKEAILSLKIHRQLTKDAILEGYLNTIYFGRGAYGIQAASQAYFAKDAKDLDLRESAVLASVLNNPGSMNPSDGRDSRENLKERYDYTLRSMAETGAIEAARADRASRRLPKFPKIESQDTYGGQRGHVLTMVRQELLKLGFTEEEIDGGGLQVTTTFTRKAMRSAEQGAREARPEGFSDKQLHTAVASVQPSNGAVRGIFAGQDYLDSQLNWAVRGGQAGSTFKAFAVIAAIKDGFSLRNTFDGNSPYELPDGSDVENQGNTSYGRVDMIQATADSVNTAFIDMTLGMQGGPDKIVAAANDAGIPPADPQGEDVGGFPDNTPGLEPNLGVALGSQTVSPINMASAYGTIANEGMRHEPFIIARVVDASGETRYKHEVEGERVIDEDIAADVSYALQQVVEAGTGTTALALGRPAAGKTGTATDSAGDVTSAWYAGFTPDMSTAVMYVRGDGTGPLDGWLPSFFGGEYPAETWVAVMSQLLEGTEVKDFPDPVFVDGEAPSGFAPTPTEEPSPTETSSPSPTETSSPSPSQSPSQSQSRPPRQSPSRPPRQSCSDGLLGENCEQQGGGSGGGGSGGGSAGRDNASASRSSSPSGSAAGRRN